MRRAGRPGPLARSAAQRQRSTMRSGQFLLPPQSPSAAASRQRRGHSPRMLSQRAGAAGCRAAHGTRPSAPLRGPLHAPRAHPAPPLSLRPAPLTGTPPFLLLLSRRSRRSFPAAARAAAALGGPRGAQRGPLPPPPLTGRAPPGPGSRGPGAPGAPLPALGAPRRCPPRPGSAPRGKPDRCAKDAPQTGEARPARAQGRKSGAGKIVWVGNVVLKTATFATALEEHVCQCSSHLWLWERSFGTWARVSVDQGTGQSSHCHREASMQLAGFRHLR